MPRIFFFIFLFTCLQFFCPNIYGQQRSDSVTITPGKDVIVKGKGAGTAQDSLLKEHSPRKATFRSAVLPGWGQAYNKKYWKIPLVYGALGTTAAVFFYNLNTYKALKQAYIYAADTIPSNDSLIRSDLRNLSPESIRAYRNSFRQNIDYSVLFFLVFWGLNVIDATVDANLKAFDVSNDISLKIKPSLKTNSAGISLIFTFNNKPVKKVSSTP